jgi:glycine/D-amino acid oxidase-like deaminating enzyme
VSAPDVAIVGGGIVGCALAALLAEAGAGVRLYEREAIAAAASGRNSGVLQHPLDPALAALYESSLALYGDLGHGFALPAEPSGVLVVSEERGPLEASHAAVASHFPELAPEWLEGQALLEHEPELAGDLLAYRLDTGRAVPPAAAAAAWVARASEAGAELRIGAAAELDRRGGRAAGVRVAGRAEPAGTVVVAAGPWTPEVVDPGGGWRPIAPLWGVNVEVRLARPPRHVIEQAGVEDLTSAGGAPETIFSIVTAGGVSAVGSTFLADEPDAADMAPVLLARGARYLPALEGVGFAARACPRPQSEDGRPLLGPLDGIDGVHVAAGHGAWGISLGPGSARLVADGILGRGDAMAPALAASRFGVPGAGRAR